QDGMAPRPVLIFQKSSPSDSSWIFFDVQSAGLGLSAAAATPSPLPLAPWQVAQLIWATFCPWSTTFASAGKGFFFAFSAGGACHAAWPYAIPASASTPSARTSDDFVSLLIMQLPPRSVVPWTARDAHSRVAFALSDGQAGSRILAVDSCAIF